jgi:hypothetical protein
VEILSGDQHSSVAGNNVEEVVDLLLVVHGYLRLALVASVIQNKKKIDQWHEKYLNEGFIKKYESGGNSMEAAPVFTFKTTEFRYSKLLKTEHIKKYHNTLNFTNNKTT